MNSQQLTRETIKIIQKNVRMRRSELGLTQEQLAEKMNMKRQGVVSIEKNATGFTLTTLSKLAIALETTIIYLITEENEY